MREFLKQCRVYFVYAGFFSLFVNLLMLALPIYMLQIFDRVITSRAEETLLVLTIAALGAYVMHGFLNLLRGRLLLGAGICLDGIAGPPVLAKALSSAARPGSNENAAGLRDVADVRSFLTGHGIFSLFDTPWTPIFLVVIFLFHPVLGILATAGAVALVIIAIINEKMTRGPFDEMAGRARRASAYIDSGMRNAEVISALGMLDDLTERWRRLNAGVVEANVTAHRRSDTLSGISRVLRLCLQILMLGTGALLVIRQHVSPGIMIAGTLILSRALSPIDTAIQSWRGLIKAREAYARLNELLAESPVQEERMELPAPKGRLEMERMSFALPGTDRFIIRAVSFSLDPGESLGLIGPSAAGKSTLARLALGVWRPTAGTVRLDGADVSTWPRKFLGPQVGYLPQDVELFSGTVGENIARLKDAPAGEIIEAARRTHAHEMILRLPKAYDTEIGTAGMHLSAGQRQRVALARALFGRPRLVVLDEPNANLDTEGEEALVETLTELARDGITTIVISHRPSLLAGMHKMLVLREGQVDLFGPRAEVMTKVTPRGIRRQGEIPQIVAGGRPS